MQNGGHLRGWRVAEPRLLGKVGNALARLAEPERFQKRYEVDDTDVMLYAMGDGNHSFATAKAIWEQIKRDAADPDDVMDHPARYALVELVNVHDPGLEFEAIHRVLFDVDVDDLLKQADAFFSGAGTPCRIEWFADDPDEGRLVVVEARQRLPGFQSRCDTDRGFQNPCEHKHRRDHCAAAARPVSGT